MGKRFCQNTVICVSKSERTDCLKMNVSHSSCYKELQGPGAEFLRDRGQGANFKINLFCGFKDTA